MFTIEVDVFKDKSRSEVGFDDLCRAVQDKIVWSAIDVSKRLLEQESVCLLVHFIDRNLSVSLDDLLVRHVLPTIPTALATALTFRTRLHKSWPPMRELTTLAYSSCIESFADDESGVLRDFLRINTFINRDDLAERIRERLASIRQVGGYKTLGFRAVLRGCEVDIELTGQGGRDGFNYVLPVDTAIETIEGGDIATKGIRFIADWIHYRPSQFIVES